MADDAQNEFDAAFGEAGVKQPAPIDPNAPLPFVPSQKHVQKNWAAEQSLSYRDVGELAYARRLAEQTGVLPKEVAEHMLPMAMVEGRPGNFGINSEGNGFPVSPATLERAKKLGIGVTDMTDPANIEKYKFDGSDHDPDTGLPRYYRNFTFQGPNGPTQGRQFVDGPPQTPLIIDHPYIREKGSPLRPEADRTRDMKQKMVLINGSSGSGDMAALMAFMLAQKHAVNKTGDAAGTVKAYNGAGPATEQYWQKVQTAKGLLSHPRNAKLMQYYNSVYLKGR